uniref:Transmembrane protein n=1 Tax=Syphacia muris TaxID=451379 RepID=A0A0N5AG93_9BILA
MLVVRDRILRRVIYIAILIDCDCNELPLCCEVCAVLVVEDFCLFIVLVDFGIKEHIAIKNIFRLFCVGIALYGVNLLSNTFASIDEEKFRMGRFRVSRALARQQKKAEKKKSRSIAKGRKPDKSRDYIEKIEEATVSSENKNDDSNESHIINDVEMSQTPIVRQDKLQRQKLPLVISKKKSNLLARKKNSVVSARVLSKKKARKLLKDKKRKDRLVQARNTAMEVA